MRRVLLILLVTAACNEITGDFSDVIAIEYAGPSSLQIEEGDTVRLEALALDLRGEPLPDVQVVWTVIELDTVQVGFTLDSLTGLITATAPGGPWRVQGRVEELRTDPPIRVTVTPSPDSMAVVEPSRIVVDSGVLQSAGLVTIVYDLTTTPDQLTPLPGVAVRYELVDPAPGAAAAASVALVVTSEVDVDPHRVEAVTGSDGQASAFARRIGLGQPDSITVDAVVLTAGGDTVPGTPGRFVVVFANN
ncbi:MAG: hypothetical protein IH965_05645 [Gemmatimonadetes bacterium]|nr:hypothetical protein [Gemmatimonadota bacterium]